MKTYEEKLKVEINSEGLKSTTLVGQDGYSRDLEAIMLDKDTMVVCTSDEGPNYLTREQAKEMFGLVEPLI